MGTNIPWYIIRASGSVAYLLLYISVIVGLYSQLMKSKRKKVGDTLSFHETLSNWACILVGIHVIFLFLDTYVSYQWFEILIPFKSTDKPIPMSFGIISMYLLVITFLTTKFRKLIGIKFWRKLHMLSPIMYVLLVLHSILGGTEFKSNLLVLMSLVPLLGFILLLYKRYSLLDEKEKVSANSRMARRNGK